MKIFIKRILALNDLIFSENHYKTIGLINIDSLLRKTSLLLKINNIFNEILKELQAMKILLIILIAFYAIFLFKNAESVGQGGQESKLNITIDEIFGKGWDAEVPEFTETKEWDKKETQTTEVENITSDFLRKIRKKFIIQIWHKTL